MSLLNVLLLEDVETDARLISHELRKTAVVQVARDRSSFNAALRSRDWDCVLVDAHLPDIKLQQAIKLSLETRPDSPVIIITGTISYREAVDALKLGAADCHEKDHRERLEHSILDAVEKRDLKAKSRRANRIEILGELNAGLAHDWNNILQAFITGPEHLLKTLDAVLKDSDRRVLSMMKSMGLRGAEMSQQITNFVRGSNGHSNKSIAPEYLLTEARLFMQQTFPREISISTETVPNTSNISCDSTLIHQVLLNLCVNARDAMPKGGSLKVRAQDVRWNGVEHVCIEVKDTGTGIPDEALPKIFDRFFTTKPVGEGTGMGLAIAKEIANDHGGDITVETSNRGTTFFLYLPVEKTQREKSDEKRVREQHRGNGETILIVDDEASMRFLLDISLSDANYKTLMACNGLEAISVFRTNGNIALLLCDVSMPTMTGMELVEALRGQRLDLPVIYMTGHADLEHAAGTLMINKPFQPDELLRIVKKALVDNRPQSGQPSSP